MSLSLSEVRIQDFFYNKIKRQKLPKNEKIYPLKKISGGAHIFSFISLRYASVMNYIEYRVCLFRCGTKIALFNSAFAPA